MQYCYSWSSAYASRYVGGLIGRVNETIVANCYAAGKKVSGNSTQAGLIGYSETPFRNCYWNASSLGGTLNHGVIGCSIDSSNSSFVLTTTSAAMGTILSGLNAGCGSNPKWMLHTAADFDNYALPMLINNEGIAHRN